MCCMKLGADCLVDMRTGLTGGSSFVETEDANVGANADADADADGDRQRAFQMAVRKHP